MSTNLRIATQNINWGGEPSAPGCDGKPRLMRLVPQLAKLEADLLVLTEFKSGELGDEIRDRLAHIGYVHFRSHPQEPYRLGTAVASRQPIIPAALPVSSAMEPWRCLGVTVREIEVFGLYFPLREAKPPYWNWLLQNAEMLRDRFVVLMGDFNTGKTRIDEAGETFDCQEEHEALEQLGFADTWRTAYPKGRDYTWYSSAGNGFRLDYIWASPLLAPHVSRVWHDHEPRITLSTDHSTVVADISIPERLLHV